MSETYIATEINMLMKDPSRAKKILDDEFPIATIMKKCFVEYIGDNISKKSYVVTDYYILDNPMTKSISKFELFPDVLKFSKFYNKKGEVEDIQTINKIKKETRETYEKRKLHSLEHLKFLAHKYLDTF
jgi:predicted DNA binding protein